MDKKILLGYCSKPHGIKGGFTFKLYNDEDSVLKKGVKISISPYNETSSINKDGEIVVIKNISFGNKTIVYLEGIIDRSIVEKMVPFEIFVERSLLPEIEEDDVYYVSDMVGLNVIEYGTNEELGVIHDFYDNGAQIVFTIRGKNENFDIPYVDEFFKVVDVEQGICEIIKPKIIRV